MKISEMEARGSKSLVSGEPMREPSWLVWTLMKGFRVVVLTVLWAGLGMAVGLFTGILVVIAGSLLQHHAPEMSLAYRHISIPVAIVSGSCAFLWNGYGMLKAAGERRRRA